MGDFTTALAVLEALRDLGVNLSLDDFGTGYSPLTYLQRLPVNEVKIDKSFVTAMNTSTSATAIIRAVIDLAHTLDLTVVAEGVEDEESRRTLTLLGCDTMQGYLLSHPLTPGELSHWLDHEARRGHPHARADHRPRLQVIPGHTPRRTELHD
jgi:EAL domain-containing protein (putative c-di-GMP-specific phosphodiesterase class I)